MPDLDRRVEADAGTGEECLMKRIIALLGWLIFGTCLATHADAATGAAIGPQTSAIHVIEARGGGTASERLVVFDRTTSPAVVADRVTIAIGPDYVHVND